MKNSPTRFFLVIVLFALSWQVLGAHTQCTDPDSNDPCLVLELPLTSPLFADTPIATVNDKTIRVKDLVKQLESMHESGSLKETETKADTSVLVDRMISRELIVQEARNIGFDETNDFVNRLNAFSSDLLVSTLMANHLQDLQPEAAEIDELYRHMSREFLLLSLEFASEPDAVMFVRRFETRNRFEELAAQSIEAGKARGYVRTDQYVRLKDLRPQIAAEIFNLSIGSITRILRSDKGYLLVWIKDSRFVADDQILAEAKQKALLALRTRVAEEFAKRLEKKHAHIENQLLDEINFSGIKSGATESDKSEGSGFAVLLNDHRVLATFKADPSRTITVADLAQELKDKYFHGVDGKSVDRLKDDKHKALSLMLFKTAAALEAIDQNLNQSTAYLDGLEEFANSLLFDYFLNRVVAPDIVVKEDDVTAYYMNHIEDYTTPRFVQLQGLAFENGLDADSALKKLNQGADFAWVSANTSGQANEDSPGVIVFDRRMLSVPSLQEDLRQLVSTAKPGEYFAHSDGNYYYAVSIRRTKESEPRDFSKVRSSIARLLFEMQMKASVEDWNTKLKEAYETRIYIRSDVD